MERALDPNVGTARHKQTQKVQNTELKGKHWPIERYQNASNLVSSATLGSGMLRFGTGANFPGP